MKKNTSAVTFLKCIISALCSITKAKSMAIRNKTNAMKGGLTELSLLMNKKVSVDSISGKIKAILQCHGEDLDPDEHDQSKAIVLYNASAPSSSSSSSGGHGEDVDPDDPDLTHSRFEDEEDKETELGDSNGSVIDLVRNSKEGDEDVRDDDDIDRVADLFIMKFHKRIRMQKLESFKMFQEMLQRSV